jgi:hypothetical protein
MSIRLLFRGFVEKVTTNAGVEQEHTGTEEYLSTSISDVVSINCPYGFGSLQCGVTPQFETALITGVSNTQRYTIETFNFNGPLPFTNEAYRRGSLVVLSGPATGEELMIDNFTGSDPEYVVSLQSVLTEALTPNTLVRIFNGCDQTIRRCRQYDNLDRFRGFPYVFGGRNFTAAQSLSSISTINLGEPPNINS